MNRISVRAVIGVPMVLLIGWTLRASGQTTFSIAGGLNVARGAPPTVYRFPGSTTPGFALQASVGRPYRDRLGWRIDVFARQFELTQPSDFAGVACPYPTPTNACCGVCPLGTSTGRVGLMGMGVNQLVNLTPSRFPLGAYLILGAETDYLYQHPSAQGALRLGASAGCGLTVPLGGRIRAFVEARYHRLLDAPTGPSWLMPVTMGLRL